MDKLLDKLMKFIVGNENLDNEQAEIVRYGLEIFIIKFAFFGAAMVISIFMDSFIQYLIFIMLFSMLRSYAGGYHANTRTACFVLSMLVIMASLAVLKIVRTYTYIMFPIFGAAVIFSIIIWRLAPIDTENKRLDENEKNIFRKRARVILALEMLGGIIVYFINKTVSCAAMLAVIISGVLLLAGYIGGKHEK